MGADFSDALAAWSAFYASVAAIAATLVGLLFVALALNPKIMSDERRTGLGASSGETFHSFLVVLTVALIALIPDDTRRTIVVTLLLVGATGLVRVAADARRARADPDPRWAGARALTLFLAPAVAYALCLWLAWAIARDGADALGWLVAVVFLLMMSAVGACWDLLREIGKDQT